MNRERCPKCGGSHDGRYEGACEGPSILRRPPAFRPAGEYGPVTIPPSVAVEADRLAAARGCDACPWPSDAHQHGVCPPGSPTTQHARVRVTQADRDAYFAAGRAFGEAMVAGIDHKEAHELGCAVIAAHRIAFSSPGRLGVDYHDDGGREEM